VGEARGGIHRSYAGRIGRLIREPSRSRGAFVVLLLVATLIVWFPSLFIGVDTSNPDDSYHITQAALHHEMSDVVGWFACGYWTYDHYEYRPLTRLSMLITWFLCGRWPLGYHLGNVLLHFACALLLGAILVRAGADIWAARLAASAWVVFPAGYRAVSWISGRGDLLCSALILLGLWFFLGWLKGKPWPSLAAASASVFLAALAKEPASVTPLFMVATAFLIPNRRHWTRRLGAAALVGIPLIAYLWIRLTVYPVAVNLEHYQAMSQPFWLSLRHVTRLLWLARPYELVAFWRPMGIYVVLLPYFGKLLVEQIAFWAALVLLLRRQLRLTLLGVAWKLIFVLPVLYLYWNHEWTHHRYLPSMGTAWLVGLAGRELAVWFCARLRDDRYAVLRWGVVSVAVLLLLAHYVAQLPPRWPNWSLVSAGGAAPPASFGRWPEKSYPQTPPPPPSAGESRRDH